MPFPRPTLTQLIQQIFADITTGLSSTASSLLRYANLKILGKVLAGAVNGLYGYLDWIALQAVPFTATGVFLEAWAALKGILRKSATAAGGAVTFTGSNGYSVPVGTPLVRSDGATFTTTEAVEISAGSAVANVVAAVPGSGGNSPAGTMFTLAVGVAGVSSTASAPAGLSGGADVELDEDLRSRMLAAYAKPPQGGAAADYVEWALEVAGVTRAWIAGNAMGAGTVSVYFMMDIVQAAYGGFPQGTNGVATLETRDIAATGDQLIVADAIYALRPVTALVFAVAPAQNVVNFTIAGISAASAATKAAITNAIAAALQAGASPGGVTLADGSQGGVTDLSVVEGAIAAIPAAAGFVITSVTASAGTVTPGPTGNIVSNAGYLPVPGVVSFL